jgi:hypothetical protein
MSVNASRLRSGQTRALACEDSAKFARILKGRSALSHSPVVVLTLPLFDATLNIADHNNVARAKGVSLTLSRAISEKE